MMLEEKISNEFQRYFLSMMATSKDNIFAHSNEIEKADKKGTVHIR